MFYSISAEPMGSDPCLPWRWRYWLDSVLRRTQTYLKPPVTCTQKRYSKKSVPPIRNFLHIYSDSHVLPDSHVVHDFFYKNPLFLRLSRNVQCWSWLHWEANNINRGFLSPLVRYLGSVLLHLVTSMFGIVLRLLFLLDRGDDSPRGPPGTDHVFVGN